jgi:hypothetical protein
MADAFRARLAQAGALFKSGAILRRETAMLAARALAALILLGVLLMIATSDGVTDWKGRPLGTDFIVFYAGGDVAREDGANAVYDNGKIYAAHQRALDDPSPDWGPFLYPPVFIFAAMALSPLPYAAALALFMGTTGALYAGATSALAGFRGSLIALAAFPATLLCLTQGQTGFLVAGLFAAGLASLFSGRQALAGLCFGLLAIKPQFGLLIPIALAAGGHWRAFAFAALSASATVLVPAIAFGPDIWADFARAAAFARRFILEEGGIGYHKIISAFSQARLLGAPLALAYSLQALVAAGAAALVFFLWRGKASDDLKGAGLILGALLATPYAVEYDLVLLAPAAALILREAMREGFRDYEKLILVFAFLVPAMTRVAARTLEVSAGWVAILLLVLMVAARAAAPFSSPPPCGEAESRSSRLSGGGRPFHGSVSPG